MTNDQLATIYSVSVMVALVIGFLLGWWLT
jgi:hypothetical protein